ncbi:hypothetical protein AeRB84_017726 [Aphanomyces euteiches]|nr:hypothetical protein AeRB84_017726 [Aphanomyces euteiches]
MPILPPQRQSRIARSHSVLTSDSSDFEAKRPMSSQDHLSKPRRVSKRASTTPSDSITMVACAMRRTRVVWLKAHLPRLRIQNPANTITTDGRQIVHRELEPTNFFNQLFYGCSLDIGLTFKIDQVTRLIDQFLSDILAERTRTSSHGLTIALGIRLLLR